MQNVETTSLLRFCLASSHYRSARHVCPIKSISLEIWLVTIDFLGLLSFFVCLTLRASSFTDPTQIVQVVQG